MPSEGQFGRYFAKTCCEKAGQKLVAMRCQGKPKVEKLLYLCENQAVAPKITKTRKLHYFRIIVNICAYHGHSIANKQWGHSAVQHVPLCLYSLLAATSQFSVSIGQKMQLTGWENANNMRNTTCADTQISNEWPYCSFLYCVMVIKTGKKTKTVCFSPIYIRDLNLAPIRFVQFVLRFFPRCPLYSFIIPMFLI